ncbi:MAG: TonB-dependent receptor [Candidatus Latescibacterota bacterium]
MKGFLSILACGLCSVASAQEVPIYKLDPIIVTASRIPSTFSQRLRSVLVITREEIENAHVQSVQDLLEYASGVDVRQRGPHGIQADVGIRGGTFEQTLILIDGIKLSDPQTGHHNLDIPLRVVDVERIEILKGHGARLYGPNAFGGVINFITRRGERTSTGVDAVAGDHGLYGAGLSVSHAFDHFRHFLSVSTRRSAGYRHNTDFETYNGYYRLTADVGSSAIDISAGLVDKEFGANGFYSNLFPEQWEHTTTGFLHAGANLGNSRISFSPRVYWRSHEDDFLLDREDPQFYRNQHSKEGYGFECQSLLHSEWGTSAFGGEVAADRIESSNLGNHARTRGGVSLEHRFNPAKRVSVTLGANAYGYSDWGWNIWPGMDLGFQATETWSVRSSFGRSFRVPTYTDLYYTSPTNRGNPDLKPEEAWTYEAGLKWQEEKVGADFGVFRREGSDLIDWVRADPDSSWEAFNISRVNTNGVEISFWLNSVNLKVVPIERVKMGYTFLDSDKGLSGLESKYVLDHLRHQLILDIDHRLVLDWRQNWKLRFEERLGGERYLVCDVQIDRRIYKGSVFLKVTNLFGTDYTEVGGVSMPGRWAAAGFTVNLTSQ